MAVLRHSWKTCYNLLPTPPMPSPTRIILFRFHRDFAVCRNHIAIIRAYNPGIEIHGLYGGPERDLKKASHLPFDSFFSVPLDDPYWKWLNGDLAIRWWYMEVGNKLRFDLVHVFEWDMVLLEPIEQRFANLTDGVALSGLRDMEEVKDSWMWVAAKRGRFEWSALLHDVKEKYAYKAAPLCGIFGGIMLSRTFLKRYAQAEIRSLCNDEVRVPLYAQAFGLPVHDTGLESPLFSADRQPLSEKSVLESYAQGQTAFHPVREKIQLSKLKPLRKTDSR